MALSRQVSQVSTLAAFCRWAQGAGYAVGEMTGFSVVHPVHAVGSWHYDQQGGYGLAADINSSGPGEMARLIIARQRAESMGLAVTLAELGPVVGHDDHLHVDVGLLSNLGAGIYHAAGSSSMSGASTLTPGTTTSTTSSTPDSQEDIVATIDELRTMITEVIRTEGVSGAGDLGRLTTALDAPTRRIVSEETAKVMRSEGVSGAGDVGRLVGALQAAGVTSVAGSSATAQQVADELAKRLAS